MRCYFSKISIYFPISFTDVPVIVTDYLNVEQRVVEGDALTPLEFVVDSNPTSTYTFRKDGVDVTGAPSPSAVNQPDPAWYTVRQTGQPYTGTATSDMSGQYEVTACNTLGCVTSKTTTFVVNCKYFAIDRNYITKRQNTHLLKLSPDEDSRQLKYC